MTDESAVDIRWNDDGSVDEIVAKGCDVHIEQTDSKHFWMQIGNEVFWFSSRGIIGLAHTETREP